MQLSRDRSRSSKLLNAASRDSSQTALLAPEYASSELSDRSGLPGEETREHEDLTASALLERPLTTRETFKLSAKFCILWMFANWSNSASFTYTSVASSTILSTTSGVFTLFFGAILGAERFTVKKCVGVFGSLSGVAIIALVDMYKKQGDTDLGSFPDKPPGEVFLGDALALLSAVFYGVYATLLQKSVGDERRINMPLFIGFIGVVAVVCAWPGIFLLQLIGLESFSLPPTKEVWVVILINALISLISDTCWAYAVLLISPLVVTVGLTLTIPLSLVGQILINSQYASAWHWVGALIIVFAFVFINYESRQRPKPQHHESIPHVVD